MKPAHKYKVKVVNKPQHAAKDKKLTKGGPNDVETCGRKEDDGRPGGE
jgi:hypothetical protein